MGESELLDAARHVLVVHAHPDDETLATGGLIAELTRRGVTVSVLTATRGEQGEIVTGSLPSGADLTAHREGEVARACAALGVTRHTFLGAGDAREAGRAPRRYTDSGMRWLDEGQTRAGPGPEAGPDALTLASPEEIAADIHAFGNSVGADLLVTYDLGGGYGHPDHVALHAPTVAAARALGAGFLEVVSDPDPEGLLVGGEDHRATITAALRCYASQLTVDGREVVHVGGQRQPIQVTCTLRDPEASPREGY